MSVGRRETSADLMYGSGLWLSGGALAWVVCKPWFVPSMAGRMKQICCMRLQDREANTKRVVTDATEGLAKKVVRVSPGATRNRVE